MLTTPRRPALQTSGYPMATAIQMQKLGRLTSEGKVVHWHKQPGEPVREGEAILTIETDKTEVEVESPVAGVMGPHAARKGDTVAVGGMLVTLLNPGESPVQIGDSPGSRRPPGRASEHYQGGAPAPRLARFAPCPATGRRAWDRARTYSRSWYFPAQ